MSLIQELREAKSALDYESNPKNHGSAPEHLQEKWKAQNRFDRALAALLEVCPVGKIFYPPMPEATAWVGSIEEGRQLMLEEPTDWTGTPLWDMEKVLQYARAFYAAQIGSPPLKEIGELLSHAMNVAASNGADSRSMPDEYVEIARWLCSLEKS